MAPLVLTLVALVAMATAQKLPLQLTEVISGELNAKGFDGTWISGDEFVRTAEALLLYDATTHTTTTLLDAQVLAEFQPWSVTVSADRRYAIVGFDREQSFRHSSTARFTALSLADGGATTVPLADGERLQLFRWAPVGNAAVYVLNNDIYYLANMTATPRRVTFDGQPGVAYNGVPDWVYEEEVLGSGSALWFSPDGLRLAFAHFDDERVSQMTYMHYGSEQYPTPVQLRYPKPGTVNPTVALLVADLATFVTSPLLPPTEQVSSDHVLLTVTWADAATVVAQWANRVQNVVQTSWYAAPSWTLTLGLRLDAPDGWLIPPEPIFGVPGTYLTIASQDGFPQLTLVRDGVPTAVTSGTFEVTDLYGVTPDGLTAYFRASQDGLPSRRQVFSTPVSGAAAGTLTCLSCSLTSPENRTCQWASAAFSTDMSRVVLTCAGPDPTVVTLHDLATPDAEVIVLEANEELREKLQTRLLPELVDVSFNGTQARLWLPPGLGAEEKPPLIVYVYAGPGSQQVTDAFTLGWGAYLTTNRRYVYALVDGRGSAAKGDATLFAVNRRLGTVEVQDQLAAAVALRDRYAFVDGTRLGIWGWSYGGYATAMAMARDVEGVFRCGVSVAPVTNWDYYDSIYTERYMGLPEDNEAGYNNSDVSRLAANFRNDSFFLLHGSGDDNVHYQNSMQLARALEDAKVLFRQQSYADEAHALAHVLPHVYVSMDEFWLNCFSPSTPASAMSSTGGAATRSLRLGSALLAVVFAKALFQ